MSLPVHTEQTHPTDPKYRVDIDGLRALAIIAVIVNHYFKDFLPSGYLGVDIFFVISGYVITSALANKKHLSFNNYILDFYTRRIKRLLPALVLCVAITSIIGFLFIQPSSPYFNDSWMTGIATLFGFSNLYLLIQATDYFGNSADLNLYTQTWSLGVEEQFYLLFPILVWLAGFSRQTIRGARNLFYCVGALSVVSVASFMYLSETNFPASYYLMTSRFWELGAGCLVFLLLDKSTSAIKFLNILRPEFIISALAVALFIPFDYQVQATVSVVLLTVLLIAALRPGSPSYMLLTLKPIVFIGLISYSLYLWHWSVLVISRWTIGIHWWSFPIQIGITFLLAFISYRYIENPLRHLVWSTKRFTTIIYGLTASIGCAVLLTGIGVPFKGNIYSGKNTVQIERYSSNNESKNLTSPSSFDESLRIKWQGCNLTPYYLGGNDYRSRPIVDQSFISKCLSDSKSKVILIGDSFASTIQKQIALAAKDVGYEYKLIFGYLCPYPLDPTNITDSVMRNCDVDPTLIKTGLLQNINPGDIVILRLNFSNQKYLKYTWLSLEKGTILAAYDSEIENLYHAVFEKGGSLLLIGANPKVPLNPECISPQWFNSLQATNCNEISLDSSLDSNFAVHFDQHLTDRYAGRYSHFEVITPTKFLCDKSFRFCPLKRDGNYLYKDNQHLSSIAVDLIYPEILSSLHRLAGK
jgi:peptidoglycan/LPS O-acetylase OafA/YrhL